MLGATFRIVVKNETGVTIDANKIVVKTRGRYFDSTGKLTFEAESADVLGQTTTIANGAFFNGSTIDNAGKANPLVEADIFIDANLTTNVATPNGNVIVYLERATAASPVWGTAGLGEVIAVLNFPNAQVQRTTTVSVP